MVLVANGLAVDPGGLAWLIVELLASASNELVHRPSSLRCIWKSPLYGDLVIDRDPDRPIVAVVGQSDLDRYATSHRLVTRTARLRAPEARP